MKYKQTTMGEWVGKSAQIRDGRLKTFVIKQLLGPDMAKGLTLKTEKNEKKKDENQIAMLRA